MRCIVFGFAGAAPPPPPSIPLFPVLTFMIWLFIPGFPTFIAGVPLYWGPALPLMLLARLLVIIGPAELAAGFIIILVDVVVDDVAPILPIAVCCGGFDCPAC